MPRQHQINLKASFLLSTTKVSSLKTPVLSTDAALPVFQQRELLPQLHRENITMRIYRELRTRIMAGQFRPGETLTLRSLSESMGVSQTPVREALLQLTSERVLSVLPGRSVRVPELSRSELHELGIIRSTLECLAARHAVAHCSTALIEELVRTQEELKHFKREQDVTELLDRNLRFHFALYTASNLPTLVATIEGFWARTGPYIRYLYREPHKQLAGPHPHEEIIEGLKQRSATLVQAALQRDIEENWKILVENAFLADALVCT